MSDSGSTSQQWRHIVTGERIAALVLLALSSLIFITALRYGLFLGDQPGPGLFPSMISGSLMLMAFLWLFQRTESGSPSPDDNPTADQLEEFVEITPEGRKRIVLVVFMAAVVIVLLERIGFFLSVSIFASTLLIAIAKLRWWKAIVGSLVFSLLIQIGAIAMGINIPDPFGINPLLGI